VFNDDLAHVFSFVRRDGNGAVFAVFNISPVERTVHFTAGPAGGDYTDFFKGDAVSVDDTTELTLEPWGYRVYVR
jgi:Alpha amylase, C-terminal all-beta domain